MLTQDILECLKQKKVLMEQILNITKQMEVQALEEAVEIGDLLEQRGLLMQRVDKCNQLIEIRLKEQTSTEQEHLRALLALQLAEDSLSFEEQQAVLLVTEITRLFHQAASLNRSVLDLLHVQHENVKKILAEEKGTGEQDQMFTFR